MVDILEWINLDELPALIVLICLLWLIGGQMTRPSEFSNQWVRRTAAVTLLAYTGLAIHAWQPSGPTDLLVILIRALLATGLVGGLASIILPLSHAVGSEILSAMKTNHCDPLADARRRSEQERAAREAKERDRRGAEERTRRDALAAVKLRQAAAEAAKAERERHAKTDEARADVIRYYDEHESLLGESLPKALFRAQLQTRFPETVTPAQAWQAAQEMISAMQPLIAQAKERQQRVSEEDRQRQLQEAQRTKISTLTAWYEDQKRELERQLPAGRERDDIVSLLWDRYDELVKQTLKDLKP